MQTPYKLKFTPLWFEYHNHSGLYKQFKHPYGFITASRRHYKPSYALLRPLMGYIAYTSANDVE